MRLLMYAFVLASTSCAIANAVDRANRAPCRASMPVYYSANDVPWHYRIVAEFITKHIEPERAAEHIKDQACERGGVSAVLILGQEVIRRRGRDPTVYRAQGIIPR